MHHKGACINNQDKRSSSHKIRCSRFFVGFFERTFLCHREELTSDVAISHKYHYRLLIEIPTVSPAGSVGASACSRDVHRTPAPLTQGGLWLTSPKPCLHQLY